MSSTPRVEIWWTLQKMGCYWTEEYSNTTSWLAVWLSGNVLASMVGVVSGSLYMRTRSLSHLAWSWVGGRLAPFYIHQMNRVNSRNGSAMMTAPYTLSWLLLLLLSLQLHRCSRAEVNKFLPVLSCVCNIV